jgi:preprotein translocase subunit YajC
MNFIFLQAPTETSPYSSYIFLGAMFLIFWLFFIRPQNKKQKEQKNFLAELDKGKDIVTTSGILGKITKIEDEIVTIEVASKVYLRITKGSISKEMTEAVYAADNKDK